MEEDLTQNRYFIVLKNEQNAEDIMQVSPNFSLRSGDFQKLLIIFLLFRRGLCQRKQAYFTLLAVLKFQL